MEKELERLHCIEEIVIYVISLGVGYKTLI